MHPDELAEPNNKSQHPNVIIEVTGDLPYYVPVPDGFSLAPTLIGAEPFQVEFSHFKPLRHPNDSHGDNVDDRLGTYVRSRCRVLFPREKLPEGDYRDEFERKALNIANNALRAIRYKAYDPAIRHVSRFDNSVLQAIEFNPDKSIKPLIKFSQRADYGPFGIRLIGILNDDALRTLPFYFNGLAPMPSAWFLILDSRYHNSIGDISHACLDLAVALEINIDSLIDLYKRFNPNLSTIEMESKSIWWKYSDGLMQATGHSLHENPDYFVNLEYIYGIRNSIAHAWKPEFRISDAMRKGSRYIDKHQPKDGHEISTSDEVEVLIKAAEEIISHTLNAFKSKYESTK